MSSPATPADETPSERQERIRRERRNAKLAAGGSARLAKITGVSGRPAPAPEEAPLIRDESPRPTHPPSRAASSRQSTVSSADHHHDDPDEVDISTHSYTPGSAPSQQQLNPFANLNQSTPLGPSQSNADMNDPSMRMLQQLMGSMGGENAAAGGDPLADLPPGMAQIMQSMMGAAAGGPGGAGGGGAFPPGLAGMFGGAQAVQEKPASAYLWRIVHAVFALSLGIYVAVTSTFDGSKVGRSRPLTHHTTDIFGDTVEAGAQEMGQRLFWLFATAQVLLQSTRFFLERGALPQSGMLGTVAGMLPEPWAGVLRTIGRYSIIYTTIVADAMVVVFVLGVVSWWRGGSVDV